MTLPPFTGCAATVSHQLRPRGRRQRQCLLQLAPSAITLVRLQQRRAAVVVIHGVSPLRVGRPVEERHAGVGGFCRWYIQPTVSSAGGLGSPE